ncbi:MAG: BON domain-containing protein [Rubrivivax sp.]|nr:MAG: BON domain-containing protein [Rubrivivax sp.]
MAAGCAPLVLGSALGGAFVASDRRTSGTQLEDKSIEIKAGSRIRDTVSIGAHVNATAYNRVVLLTGEVATEADRAAIEQAVARIENVQSVVNEIAVTEVSSFGSRTNDTVINGKIKASFVDARDMFSNAYKVVVERGDVYLMGLVTEREAMRGAEVASGVSGVNKVVKVFTLITEDELARRTPAPAPAPAASNP